MKEHVLPKEMMGKSLSDKKKAEFRLWDVAVASLGGVVAFSKFDVGFTKGETT